MTPLALGSLAAALTLLVLPTGRPDALVGPPQVPGSAPASAPLPNGTWPVQPASIINDFDDPPPYAPGHRGLDLAASPGQVVVAAGAGTVTSAGMVAGRPVVAVTHDSGIRTTYLPVSPLVHVGDRVRPGDPLGVLVPSGHCMGITCLHWGARRGDVYLDPRSLLPLRAGPIVLLPFDDP